MNSSFNFLNPHFPDTSLRIPIHRYQRRHAGNLARALLEAADADPTHTQTIGVSISQGYEGVVDSVAFATVKTVCILNATPDSEYSSYSSCLPHEDVFKRLLAGKDGKSVFLAGFDMPRLALRLYNHFGSHVRGTDLSTACSPSHTEAWLPAKVASAKLGLSGDMEKFRFDRLWHDNNDSGENLCLRAWWSAILALASRAEIESTKKVDTRNVRKDILKCLGGLVKQTDILSRSLPKEMVNEYESFDLQGYKLTNARYKTRVRKSKQAIVVLTEETGNEYTGHAGTVQGKITSIRFEAGQQPTRAIQHIRVIGQHNPTNSEKGRNALLLKVLQDDVKLINYRFVRMLWFPTKEDMFELSLDGVEEERTMRMMSNLEPFTAILNPSQKEVVSAMVSSRPSVVIVHGPPGTGKTMTISSAAAYWSWSRQPVWIISHSNVSVKNIAEKLWKREVPFKLIVSKEFYVEWHEHIYTNIAKHVIRGDEMPQDPRAMKRLLRGTQVILCTLGMLSNPALDDNCMFRLVPVEKIVIDEASQINVFEYLSIFQKFSDLEKVCFFGDPKQLPPFRQENAIFLQCIFDIDHLQSKSYFLDAQYRMPTLLGRFISQAVYDSRLESVHELESFSCVSFVDVAMGRETNSGLSWTNTCEISCIINLVHHYYNGKDFCIITPYDAQRSQIEKALKAEQLPWDRVFNVDSFQGNEADYVLISVVRTEKVGFLKSIQRMNVMLTRCRAGMVIVSNKRFLQNVGYATLLGRLAKYWDEEMRSAGLSFQWATDKEVLNEAVNLPGVRGRNAPMTSFQTYTPLVRITPNLASRYYGYLPPKKHFDVKDLFPRRDGGSVPASLHTPSPTQLQISTQESPNYLSTTSFPPLVPSPQNSNISTRSLGHDPLSKPQYHSQNRCQHLSTPHNQGSPQVLVLRGGRLVPESTSRVVPSIQNQLKQDTQPGQEGKKKRQRRKKELQA